MNWYQEPLRKKNSDYYEQEQELCYAYPSSSLIDDKQQIKHTTYSSWKNLEETER